MNNPKIYKGSYNDRDGYFIQTEDDYIRYQRSNPASAMDRHMSSVEYELIALCEYILYLEGLI